MYSRETEIRMISPNDVYKLGLVLDDNDYWKKLMEIIPKELNSLTCSADGSLDWEQVTHAHGFKYNNDHIRLIENATKRSGESRLHSQILFDEWGTSGRKHERPTVGVLLQLLVRAELFRAADFVAKNFLNEPPPARPLNGPAAKIDISLSDDVFDDIAEVVNNSSYYPGTSALNDNAYHANSLVGNNIDYYTKYQRLDKQTITLKDNIAPPKPPPRTQRSARLLQLQQQQQQSLQHQQHAMPNDAVTAIAESSIRDKCESLEALTDQDTFDSNSDAFRSSNIPNISILTATTAAAQSHSTASTSDSQPNTLSTNLPSEAPIPMISILGGDGDIGNAAVSAMTTESLNNPITTDDGALPVLSALNLNGERDTDEASSFLGPGASGSQSLASLNIQDSCHKNDGNQKDQVKGAVQTELSVNNDAIEDEDSDDDVDDDDDDDDDIDPDDNSIPNLSIFERRGSNNDSSLTTVTGTSGENSFELSMNDCSSASNENIPCLSALK